MRKNRNLKESLKTALWGLKYFIKSQRNVRYHSIASIFSLYLGWVFGVPKSEFVVLCLAVTLVWVAEILNSSIEKLLDMASPRISKRAKKVKDMAAAAVLVASFGALVMGLIILGPPLYDRMLSYR